VVSDFIFGLRDAPRSVRAGLDIEMPFRQQRMMHLHDALGDGRLTEADVDRCVTRIVATFLRFAPVFTKPASPERVLGPAHRALAREAAQSSMVLLQNEGLLLPLDLSSVRRIAVIGRLAAVANLGDRGSSDVTCPDPVTLLAGLQSATPHVVHHDHDASLAAGADVAVVVVGCTYVDEGEYIDNAGSGHLMADHFPPMTDADRAAIAATRGSDRPETRDEPQTFAGGGDRHSLRLRAEDEALVLATVAQNPKTIVVVMGGSAIVMEAWRHNVPAVLLVWYPGVEGGNALADVLLGVSEPGGRLPFAIPTDEAHLVHFDSDAHTALYDLFHGQWLIDRDGIEPVFPFGFGLGYADIALESAQLAPSTVPLDHVVEVVVSNRAPRAGTTVVQVYGGVPGSRFERPARRLIGFRRISLAAGETRSIDLPCSLAPLAVRQDGEWLHEEGEYALDIGLHAHDPAAITLAVTVRRQATASRPDRVQRAGSTTKQRGATWPVLRSSPKPAST
jgi:beta-glucosidase